jgi:hypothetical protein
LAFVQTPEFLLWSLEYHCPVRGFEDGTIPERVERQLRAARAYGDAAAEGRIFEGLALAPPNGFRCDDALTIYGGAGQVETACRDCSANALQRHHAAALAGCFGLTPLPQSVDLHAAIESAVDRADASGDCSRLFSATRPTWYGLWMQSPLRGDQLAWLVRVLPAVDVRDASVRQALAELSLAAQAAMDHGLALHARLYPPGRAEGTWWRLVPHCPRCKAEWGNATSRECRVCGYVGHPAPDKKRHVRGMRPYFPLDRLLGEQQAAELLLRYADFRERPASPDREQTPPSPAPPDSPPAG